MTTEKVDVGGWLRQQVDRLRPRASQAPGFPAPRHRVAVVTDSAAALPPEWVAESGAGGRLTIVPMPVIIGEHVFSEDDAELESHISLAMAAGSAVRTSRPSPGQFDRAYKAAADAGFDAVVSIHISSRLSGTLESAQMAADRALLPVLVLDSGTVGMAQGVGVQAAVAAASAGAAVDEVIAAAQSAVESTAVFFYVPSLEQLRRGGRISFASSWVGTVLDLKPLLAIRDGAVVPLEKVRTAAKAIARLENLAAGEILRLGEGRARVSLHHFGNEAQARSLAEALLAEFPGMPAPGMTRLPAVLAAHAGLGVLVVVVSDGIVPPQPAPEP